MRIAGAEGVMMDIEQQFGIYEYDVDYRSDFSFIGIVLYRIISDCFSISDIE